MAQGEKCLQVTIMNFDAINNFYENLVFEAISRELENSDHAFSQDEIEDIACIALNALPSRYVRHTVDTVYFQSDNERIGMEKNVHQAVLDAIEKVKSNPSIDDSSISKSA